MISPFIIAKKLHWELGLKLHVYKTFTFTFTWLFLLEF